MGVDLNIWVLGTRNKAYTMFSLDRTSASWDDLKRLEYNEVPEDFWKYEAYEYFDYNATNKNGPGKRNGKHNLDVRIRKTTHKELPIEMPMAKI